MDLIQQAATMSSGTLIRSGRIGAFVLIETDYVPFMRLRRHSHPHSIISLIASGGTEEGYRSTPERFGPGSVSIKPREVDHSNVVSSAGMRGLAITRCDDDTQMGADWTAAVSLYGWRTGGPVVRTFFDVYRMLREPDGPDRDLALDERLALLVGELGQFAAPSSIAPRWLFAVRDRLHALSEGAVPGVLLGAFAGVHPVYLARAFRRHFGCCMSKYVQRLRVRRAAELLHNPRLPPAQAAQEAGFADQAHLCRVFKSEFGMTPGRYRLLVGNSGNRINAGTLPAS